MYFVRAVITLACSLQLTPGDALHVLLADGTGHGLAASLNVMPITQPFYAMTEKGISLGKIASELNAKAKEWLPTGRFVATTLVCVDPYTRTIEVWNGGNPPPFVLAGNGAEIYGFAASHVPFGILSRQAFDARTELFSYAGSVNLVMCSDGVTEAECGDGRQFGRQRLVEALGHAAPENRLAALKNALGEHFDGHAPVDDISVAMIACGDPPAAAIGSGQGVSATCGLGDWQAAVTLSAAELRRVDAVPMLLHMAKILGCEERHASHLFLVLSELYNNALDHGILRLHSGLKLDPEGMERYLDLRAQRLAALNDGFVTVMMEVVRDDRQVTLRIRVRDSGEGFDLCAVGPESAAASSHAFGRGIALVRRLCQSVDYLAPGNEVVASYVLGANDRAPEAVQVLAA